MEDDPSRGVQKSIHGVSQPNANMGTTVSRLTSRDLGVLVIDGECDFCRRCVRIMRRYLRHPPRVVAWQESNLAQLGLTTEMCQGAVQWVSELRGNRREQLSAHDAIARVLRNGGGGWPVIGVILTVPGVHWLSGVVYRWVSRNRGKWYLWSR